MKFKSLLVLFLLFSFNVYADSIEFELVKTGNAGNKESLSTYYSKYIKEAKHSQTTMSIFKNYDIIGHSVYVSDVDDRKNVVQGSNLCLSSIGSNMGFVYINSIKNCGSVTQQVVSDFNKAFLDKLICFAEKGKCTITSFDPTPYSGLNQSQVSCYVSERESKLKCTYKGGLIAAYRDMVKVALIKRDGINFVRFIADNVEVKLPVTATLGYKDGTDASAVFWQTDNFQIYPERYTRNQVNRIYVCGKYKTGKCTGLIDASEDGSITINGKSFISSDELVLINETQILEANKVGKVGQTLLKPKV